MLLPEWLGWPSRSLNKLEGEEPRGFLGSEPSRQQRQLERGQRWTLGLEGGTLGSGTAREEAWPLERRGRKCRQ